MVLFGTGDATNDVSVGKGAVVRGVVVRGVVDEDAVGVGAVSLLDRLLDGSAAMVRSAVSLFGGLLDGIVRNAAGAVTPGVVPTAAASACRPAVLSPISSWPDPHAPAKSAAAASIPAGSAVRVRCTMTDRSHSVDAQSRRTSRGGNRVTTSISGVSWAAFAAASESLAERMQQRFASHLHAVMATVRRDGAPRMSGMEAPIRDGHMWLGMEHSSAKAADLRRDPRLGLHSAPDTDEELEAGDARIEGRAVPADAAHVDLFVRGHRHQIDDPAALALFTVAICRAVLVRVADRQLVVETWTPTNGLTERRLS